MTGRGEEALRRLEAAERVPEADPDEPDDDLDLVAQAEVDSWDAEIDHLLAEARRERADVVPVGCRPACRPPPSPGCATTPTPSPASWPGRCRGRRRRRRGSAAGSTRGSRPGSASRRCSTPTSSPAAATPTSPTTPSSPSWSPCSSGASSPTVRRSPSRRRSRWCSPARWCAAASTPSTTTLRGRRVPRRRLEDQPPADADPSSSRSTGWPGPSSMTCRRARAGGLLLRPHQPLVEPLLLGRDELERIVGV